MHAPENFDMISKMDHPKRINKERILNEMRGQNKTHDQILVKEFSLNRENTRLKVFDQ